MKLITRLYCAWLARKQPAPAVPPALALAQEKRRLERACQQAGITRSVSRRVLANYFQGDNGP